MPRCKDCGIEEKPVHLFKGFCERCMDNHGLTPCDRCGEREATREIAVHSNFTQPVCEECLANACYVAYASGY